MRVRSLGAMAILAVATTVASGQNADPIRIAYIEPLSGGMATQRRRRDAAVRKE